jgi:NAD(P)-dependent dehydrogenase (short-subunit alcohol dehydrogenase family)
MGDSPVSRIAVVLGVGRDLGRSTALALARDGADVALVARGSEVTREVAGEIRGLGRHAWCFEADLTDLGQCVDLGRQLAAVTDRVDVAVSIVGGAGTMRSSEFEHAGDDRFDGWRAVFETTFWAPTQSIWALVGLLRAADQAHVVIVNSLAAVFPRAGRGAYTAAKAALAGLPRVMALELAADGIRVNGLHMGAARTIAWEQAVSEAAEREGIGRDEVIARYASTSPLDYVPHPDEIADAIAFLASARSRAITGQGVHANLGAWMT